MRVPVVVCLTCVGLLSLATFPKQALAQVPTRASEPVLRAPTRDDPATVPASPQATEPAPAAAPAAAAPAAPAPVSAAPAPSGVTQLPPAAAPPTTASTSSAATASKGTYSTANFSLSLEGVTVGYLRAVEGGAAVGTVVVDNVGPDNIQKKHVTGVRYEPLTFDVGLDSKPVVEWVTSAWQGKNARKSGSVQILDYDFNIVGGREFTDALITGTTVSALDNSNAKAPLVLTVTVAPESVREVGGSGKAQGLSPKSKPISSGNFRFEMGDLETSFVRRIEPFTVGQQATANEIGEMRSAEKQPSTLEFPNLKIRMAARPYPNWSKWRDEFLLKGNGGEAQEKNGAIVLLDPTLQNELGRINLFNCGLIRLGGERQEAAKESANTVTADLYCEKMELAIKN
ncbi:MAG TPA: hypothetical protein VNO19_13155 [Gemmatimonadales bacterium]|nr:hypothetical protein [Gemmatimonadales bacterium]